MPLRLLEGFAIETLRDDPTGPVARATERRPLTVRVLARRVALITTGLSIAFCLATVAAQALRPGNAAPEWGSRLVVVLASVAIVTALASRNCAFVHVLLAATLGATVAVPWIASELHPWPDGSVFSLAVGTTIAAAVLLTALLTPEGILDGLFVALTAAIGISLAMGIGRLWGVPSQAFYLLNDRDWVGFWQLRGFLGHPNTLAILVCLAIVVQIGMLRRLTAVGSKRGRFTDTRVRRLRAATFGSLVLSALVLVWTQSRTGWIACLGALVVVLVPFDRLKWTSIWVGVLLLLAAAAVVAAPVLAHRGFEFNGRYYAWAVAESAVEHEPWTGYGAFLFSPEYWSMVVAPPWEPSHAHNQLLQTVTLAGVIGLVALLGSSAVTWWVALRSFAPYYRVAAGTFVVVAAFSSIEPTLGVGTVAASYLPALVCALVFGAAWQSLRSGVATDPTPATPPHE